MIRTERQDRHSRGVGAASILALMSLDPGRGGAEKSSTPAISATSRSRAMTLSPISPRTRPWKARPNIRHRWLGATWHFASAENRDLFEADPVKYAPQYGGHCADGVSFGTITTNIDPKAWRIIEGKLYLSYDPGAADGFEKNPSKVVNSQEVLAGGRANAWCRKSCRKAGSRRGRRAFARNPAKTGSTCLDRSIVRRARRT